jgi:hypothetical protein
MCYICRSTTHSTSDCNNPVIVNYHNEILQRYTEDVNQINWIKNMGKVKRIGIAKYLNFPISWDKDKHIIAFNKVYTQIINLINNNQPFDIPVIVQDVKDWFSIQELQYIRTLRRDIIQEASIFEYQSVLGRRTIQEVNNPEVNHDLTRRRIDDSISIFHQEIEGIPNNIQSLNLQNNINETSENYFDSRSVFNLDPPRRSITRQFIREINNNRNVELVGNINRTIIQIMPDIQDDLINNSYFELPILRFLMDNENYRIYFAQRLLAGYVNALRDIMYHNSISIQSKISIIDKFKIQLTHSIKQHLEEPRDCNICYEINTQNSCITNCNHHFCVSCISQYLISQKNKNEISCPFCRTNILSLDCHSLESIESISIIV